MQFFSDAGSIKHISAKLGRVEGMLRHSILNCGSKPSSLWTGFPRLKALECEGDLSK